MDPDTLTLLFLFFSAGLALGAAAVAVCQRLKGRSFREVADQLIAKAEEEAEELRRNGELELERKRVREQQLIDENWQKEQKRIRKEEERLNTREEKLENRMGLVEKKLSEIERREAVISRRREELQEEKEEQQQKERQLLEKLEQLSGMTGREAEERLLKQMEEEVKQEMAGFILKSQKEAEEEAEQRACRIVATAIQRVAVPCVAESTVLTVPLPNDEMKGRIIGREGRNIRALERAAGVNLVIDDTPAVVVSGFDPIRLHTAKKCLEELIKDGRIHPSRIEEALEKAKKGLEKEIVRFGQDAAARAGASGLHPELIRLLGKLKYRQSHGQNVLEHSLEVSHLMGLMAAELGLDARLAKKIGLLHDIGKAASHEIPGSHAVIGHDLALKYGEPLDVATGIGSHHNEIEATTIEGGLCGAADALSAARPGARIEAVEEYIQRVKELEKMAYGFPGVARAYALQAGRELRVFVLPEMIDDAGILNLARDLTKKIEQQLRFSGKIKVTVTRENRAVHYAL